MGTKAAKGCLLLHDLTAQPSQLNQLAQALEEAGYPVSAPNLFGFVPRDQFDRTPAWQRVLQQAESGYEELVGVCASVAVIGVGMGGTVAAIIAEEYQAGGLIVIGAATRPASAKEKLARKLPFVPLSGAAGSIKAADVGTLDKLAANNTFSITCDTLLMTLADDPDYDSAAGTELLSAVRSARKREIALPGTRLHDVMSTTGLQICEEVLKFMQGQ